MRRPIAFFVDVTAAITIATSSLACLGCNEGAAPNAVLANYSRFLLLLFYI